MIVLPFPSSKLSGHDKRVNWARARVVKDHRDWAHTATLAARPAVPTEGDIDIHLHFVPPDNRGDRANFYNRCKPYLDGIAEALGVNDKRFVPSISFAQPAKPGRVEIVLSTAASADRVLHQIADASQGVGSDASANSTSEPDHNRIGAAT